MRPLVPCRAVTRPAKCGVACHADTGSAFNRLHNSDQHFGSERAVVLNETRCEINNAKLAFGSYNGGFEYVRVRQVALHPVGGYRSVDAEAPTEFRVKKRGKDRLAIKARHATPCDVAVAPDMRGKLTVTNEPKLSKRHENTSKAYEKRRYCGILVGYPNIILNHRVANSGLDGQAGRGRGRGRKRNGQTVKTMMRRSVPYLALLLVAFVSLAAVADTVVARRTRQWLSDDLRRRAELGISAMQPTLERAWPGDSEPLGGLLERIAHDERIVGVLACSGAGEELAATEDFPSSVDCGSIAARRETGVETALISVNTVADGLLDAHLTAVPLPRTSGGYIVVAQDASVVSRRESATRLFLLAVQLVLAILASMLTVWFAHLARRRWLDDLRRALAGEQGRESTELKPLLADVRRLARALADERADVDRSGPWSAERLRMAMRRVLGGERLVVLANREPYIHIRTPDGAVKVRHPASGLVTALEPVLRACSGVWVAHGSGSADKDVVDKNDRIAVPPGNPSYLLRRVWLSEEEEAGYYYGIANEALWPVCHVAHARPVFRAADWEYYRQVNRRFADAVCEEVDRDDPIILVQDYHFALAPRYLRERLPRATIIAFWHIPWPNAERIGICPWRDELLDGLLGASVVAFHTQQHCNHFLDAVDTYLEARIDREATAISQGEHRTLVRSYPISVAWPVQWVSEAPSIEVCRSELREKLDLPPQALIGLGVDRLDYTKGIEERLRAVDELLQRYPEYRGRFTFVQVAAPSRTRIRQYRDLETDVAALVEEINSRWRQGSYRPIVLLREHLEPPEIFRMMRGAELLYVSSLHDGMNLVAKEFVAARDDEAGVLVLSRFTGAARELTEALVVNPYDLPRCAEALASALSMPLSEQRERMIAMRRLVAEFNVYRWAGRMLLEAADLRRRQQLADKLSSITPPSPQPPVTSSVESPASLTQ